MAFRELPCGWMLIVLTILGPVAACGSGENAAGALGSDGATGGGGADGGAIGDSWAAVDGAAQGRCANGEVFCATCNGGGYCAHDCTNLACPDLRDSGISEAASAEAGECAAGQVTCLDCNGGPFCVSGGCPAATCPIRVAGIDASPPVDAAGDTRSDSNVAVADGGPGSACRSDSDCAPLTACNGPAPRYACVCPGGSCKTDTDCAADGGNFICQSFCAAACTRQCVVGCTDATCPEGTHCGTSHRCEPRPCTKASDCPAQFDCVPAAAACGRRVCQKDTDCASGGYCVDGSCSVQLGMCFAQPG